MPKPDLETVWLAKRPDCDLCITSGLKNPARFDAKMHQGPWAYMCQIHFDANAIGLGLGVGQRILVKGEEDA